MSKEIRRVNNNGRAVRELMLGYSGQEKNGDVELGISLWTHAMEIYQNKANVDRTNRQNVKKRRGFTMRLYCGIFILTLNFT